MINLVILGSTGSIGVNTLSVVRNNLASFNVFALSGNKNVDLMYKQCLEFSPNFVVMVDKNSARKLKSKLIEEALDITIMDKLIDLDYIVSQKEVDYVMAAIVGTAGLSSAYAAIDSGKRLLLANKESLVAAGNLFMDKAKQTGAEIIPVDSEHNAIHQCLENNNKKYSSDSVDEIILTASGGPFYRKNLEELRNITPEEACKHPNWSMGQKISIDSSTMVNKALEVIEAFWLFNVPIEKLKVIIHPESIVHSMVKYLDGSFIAQLGAPDMRVPISYSLFYPEKRLAKVDSLDLTSKPLTFHEVDRDRFQAIAIVYDILERKDWVASIVFNAANEVLVESFLSGYIKYLDITIELDNAVTTLKYKEATSIKEVIAIDQQVREYIKARVSSLMVKANR